MFEKLCYDVFQFLIDEFGFKVVATEWDPFGTEIEYRNQTTSINIRFEPREYRVFVFLSQLVNNRCPEYADAMNGFYLDDLIELRSPSSRVKQKFQEAFTPASCFESRAAGLERILWQYATALRQHAIDILTGDFRVFTTLAQIVAKRAEELQQQKRKH